MNHINDILSFLRDLVLKITMIHCRYVRHIVSASYPSSTSIDIIIFRPVKSQHTPSSSGKNLHSPNIRRHFTIQTIEQIS